ncbi:nuclease [Methanococcoides methylutens]|uniref:Nuclease n=1 Tax=Methanococcoides methylutens TaxID=2226 RepID=A0A099T4D9_METMT|nr:thermonuclease family protein [Methanococcoides methylutens]KGK99043.1 nuclease [Methanococcoides methylutens]
MRKIILSLFLLSSILSVSGCVGPDEAAPGLTVTFANVTEVIDGDTFVISTGEKVRLIGVDTPERGEPYYDEAKQYMIDNLPGRTVRLEADVSDTDRYGRLLRYVWLDGSMVNNDLVLSGLAVSKTYEPDTYYQDQLEGSESYARERGVGLWSEAASQEVGKTIISYLDAGRYVGQTVTVEGTVVRTTKHDGNGIIYLNFHDPYEGYFTVVIWSEDWDRFLQSPEVYYDGKHVLVTGKVIEYKGSPEIIVENPSEIVIVSD